eukprot:m.45597 g.45597  ORF g.45597 m.45597 type:complete len:197 (+) comp7229_c0_seq1:104-694(+)
MSKIVTKHLLDTAARQGGKLVFTAAAKNIVPIQNVLAPFLEAHDRVTLFEIGSGSGQHIAQLATAFPKAIFQPSDVEPSYLESILAYKEDGKLDNLLKPILFNCDGNRPAMSDMEGEFADMSITFDLVFCSNVIHITPWSVCEGMVASASKLLRQGSEQLQFCQSFLVFFFLLLLLCAKSFLQHIHANADAYTNTN